MGSTKLQKRIILNASFAPSLINFRGDLIRALVEAGHEIHATAPIVSAEVRTALSALGCEVHEVPLVGNGLNPAGDLRYLRAQLSILRRLRPDLVVNYTIKPNIWCSFAARLTGCKAVSMVTGVGYLMLDGQGTLRRLVQAVARQLYRAALSGNDAVIFQNRDDVADFVDAGLVKPSQVRLVSGSGVNLEHFHPAPLPAEPVFLMIARLLRTKGIREYVEAAMQVRSNFPDARFQLVGMADSGPDGIDPGALAEWERQGLEYLGEKADVRPAIAAASAFVLPSYREGTPRSVLEAMAMGRPIITTDVPGCRETVVPGVNGFLVPARVSKPLAQAMEQLIADPALRTRMGEASLAEARKRYDVNIVNRALMGFLPL